MKNIKNFEDFSLNEGVIDYMRKTFNPNVDDLLQRFDKYYDKITKVQSDMSKERDPFNVMELMMKFISISTKVIGDINKIDKKSDELEEDTLEKIKDLLNFIGNYFPKKIKGRLPEEYVENLLTFPKKYNAAASKFGADTLNMTKLRIT